MGYQLLDIRKATGIPLDGKFPATWEYREELAQAFHQGPKGVAVMPWLMDPEGLASHFLAARANSINFIDSCDLSAWYRSASEVGPIKEFVLQEGQFHAIYVETPRFSSFKKSALGYSISLRDYMHFRKMPRLPLSDRFLDWNFCGDPLSEVASMAWDSYYSKLERQCFTRLPMDYMGRLGNMALFAGERPKSLLRRVRGMASPEVSLPMASADVRLSKEAFPWVRGRESEGWLMDFRSGNTRYREAIKAPEGLECLFSLIAGLGLKPERRLFRINKGGDIFIPKLNKVTLWQRILSRMGM